MTFEQWKTEYAHRVMLMAGIKTMDAARETMPHDDILREQWKQHFNPNEAADEEMTDWDE